MKHPSHMTICRPCTHWRQRETNVTTLSSMRALRLLLQRSDSRVPSHSLNYRFRVPKNGVERDPSSCPTTFDVPPRTEFAVEFTPLPGEKSSCELAFIVQVTYPEERALFTLDLQFSGGEYKDRSIDPPITLTHGPPPSDAPSYATESQKSRNLCVLCNVVPAVPLFRCCAILLSRCLLSRRYSAVVAVVTLFPLPNSEGPLRATHILYHVGNLLISRELHCEVGLTMVRIVYGGSNHICHFDTCFSRRCIELRNFAVLNERIDNSC